VQPYKTEVAYSVSGKENRPTWAKLITQVYVIDPLVCSRYAPSSRAKG
jgi:hypothetical protein